LKREFWQTEYYDHLIRDEADLERAINYVLANPSKAGLHNWKWLGSSTGVPARGVTESNANVPARGVTESSTGVLVRDEKDRSEADRSTGVPARDEELLTPRAGTPVLRAMNHKPEELFPPRAGTPVLRAMKHKPEE
jgi:hypothetical protein